MSTRGGKAIFGVGLVVFGLLVFLIASGYVIDRELPKWLAAAVGGLAFPVLPVTWHVIGERRRRTRLAAAKTQPKTTLAPGDRYLMRAVTVAAVVLVPMFVVGRTKVLRAAWDNKTWFIPDESYDAMSSTDDMLAHVPSDADAVVLIRDHDDKDKRGVMAYGTHQLVMFAPLDNKEREDSAKELEQMNKQRDKIPFVKIDELQLVPLGKTMAIVTAGWKSAIRSEGAGPRAAIKTELAKAPADAIVAMAWVPAKPELGLEKMHGWLQQKATNDKLTVEGQLDAVDAASAEKALDLVRALWKKQLADLPEKCRDEVDQVTDKVELERKGATISFHVVIQPEQLFGLMMCGMSSPEWKGAERKSD